MARLILSIVPSNQDRNPVLGGGNEQGHIAPLAQSVAAAASSRGITSRVFTGKPESQDSPPGSLSGLWAQQRAARDWIAATRQPGDLTVSLNLHSDSGHESHMGYYFDGPGTVSEWLGRALAERICGYFGGKIYHADYSAYIFAGTLHAVAAPVLLEVGAHTVASDVAAVRDHHGEIAEGLVDTLVAFFGLDTIPPIDTGALRVYPEWAIARLERGQDSRDVPAFRSHLAALGCADDPHRYGVP